MMRIRHIQQDERIRSCRTKLGFCGGEQKGEKKEEKAEWIKWKEQGTEKVT